MREGGFDAAFLAVGAHIGKRAYIPAGEAAHILDAVSLLRGMEGEEPPLLGRRVVVYGGGNTAIDAARTAKRLGASEAIIVYRRTRERMPAHDFEVEEALEEGVLMKWLSTIKHADEGKLVLEKMELDETGFPQPTGEFEELEADSLVLALGQEADLSLLDGVPGIEIEDGVVKVDAEHDDRPRGDLRRRRHGARRANRHRRRRPRQAGRAQHRRLAARQRATSRPPSTSSRASRSSTPGTTPTRRRPSRPQLDVDPPPVDTSTRSSQGLDETNALFEARRCLSLRQLLRMRQLLRRLPRQRRHQARPTADGYAFDLDYCKGCGICVTGVSVRRDRDDPRDDLRTPVFGTGDDGGNLPMAPRLPGGTLQAMESTAAAAPTPTAPTPQLGTKYVYDFAEGSRDMRDLLGGKGANICEMTRLLGADIVPGGFVITTEACVIHMSTGRGAGGARGTAQRCPRAFADPARQTVRRRRRSAPAIGAVGIA